MTPLVDRVAWEKGEGLVPAIVQHAVTGRVLMLGYMNAEALGKTLGGGLVTFFSRSRQCLWTKGETSGNTLKCRSIELDCDADTLLVFAVPTGPTCHSGLSSCFDEDVERAGFGFLGELECLIGARIDEAADGSYTVQLANAGAQRIAQKVGEEGVEVALAGATGDSQALIGESADLIYHLLVLLRQQGVSFADVVQSLDERHRP